MRARRGALRAAGGIINPSEMSAANSIEIAIWVAVGGAARSSGPVIGAIVNLRRASSPSSSLSTGCSSWASCSSA